MSLDKGATHQKIWARNIPNIISTKKIKGKPKAKKKQKRTIILKDRLKDKPKSPKLNEEDKKLLQQFPVLQNLVKTDQTFAPHLFLDKAKLAHQHILSAYHQGNLKKLKPLVSQEIMQAFTKVIKQNEQNKIVDIIQVKPPQIKKAICEDNLWQITILFDTQLYIQNMGDVKMTDTNAEQKEEDKQAKNQDKEETDKPKLHQTPTSISQQPQRNESDKEYKKGNKEDNERDREDKKDQKSQKDQKS